MSKAENEIRKTLVVDGRKIEVGHPDRVYFPASNFTKFDMLGYYASISGPMARQTRRRALSLRRYPCGIGQKGFFQKRVGSYFPPWIPRATLPIKEGSLEYAVGGDPAALVWLASLGTIEFHAMLSRTDKPYAPDQIIFDLDPPDDYSDDVRLAALGLKAICDDLGLASLVKTTGSRGFHVIVPIARHYDFDQTRTFARLLAARLLEQQPGRLTLDMRKAQRQGRILVDIWRNGYGQTAIAPFSIRARPGAPIAVPLHWDDLKSRDIHPRAVTLGNYRKHAEKAANAWPQTLGPARQLEKALKILQG